MLDANISERKVFDPPLQHHTCQDGVLKSLLYNGATFKGHQKSSSRNCDVEVVIQNVDLEKSYLSGYLTIIGLTEDQAQITTYFDAEIIGEDHHFLTRKWEADHKVDTEHWAKFSSFFQFKENFNEDEFDYSRVSKNSTAVIFMRWKEHFVVPNHKVRSIVGASFEGFYYICFQQQNQSIEGYYFYKQSEMYQSLKLHHVPSPSQPIFQFR